MSRGAYISICGEQSENCHSKMKSLLEYGLLDGRYLTVIGQTLAENIEVVFTLAQSQ